MPEFSEIQRIVKCSWVILAPNEDIWAIVVVNGRGYILGLSLIQFRFYALAKLLFHFRLIEVNVVALRIGHVELLSFLGRSCGGAERLKLLLFFIRIGVSLHGFLQWFGGILGLKSVLTTVVVVFAQLCSICLEVQYVRKVDFELISIGFSVIRRHWNSHWQWLPQISSFLSNSAHFPADVFKLELDGVILREWVYGVGMERISPIGLITP